MSKLEVETSFARGLSAVAALTLALGCGDPVRNRAQDALGPEVSGVPKGPNHRAGQPCLVCHDGSTAPEFAIAGTLFVTSTARTPLAGGVVTLTDAQTTRVVSANCVGNFYLHATDYSPAYPLTIEVKYGDTKAKMVSQVHREGACASCHTDPPSPTSAGHVYLSDMPPDVTGCP